jgi:hypothetical protein
VNGEIAEDYPSALAPLISLAADPVETEKYCQRSGPVCYNCTTAPICVSLPTGNFLLVGHYNCAEQNPNEPHCNNGICSATVSHTCVQETPFECTGEGYFPDPNDCQKFYLCDKTLNATTYTCSTNYVYFHASKSCRRKNAASDCAVIKCTYRLPLEYVVYPKDPSVYGICIRDQPTVMMKCKEGEEFDTKTSQCKVVCKKEGIFEVDGCRKFYECVKGGSNRYNLVEGECPLGTKFDVATGSCVTGNCTA